MFSQCAGTRLSRHGGETAGTFFLKPMARPCCRSPRRARALQSSVVFVSLDGAEGAGKGEIQSFYQPIEVWAGRWYVLLAKCERQSQFWLGSHLREELPQVPTTATSVGGQTMVSVIVRIPPKQ